MTQETIKHVKGLSRFIGDEILPVGTLHARVFASPIAAGWLESLDISAALAVPGVVRILTAKDIPGKNQIGDIIADESVLAFHHLHFIGKPIAVVLAETPEAAAQALPLIQCVITPAPVCEDSKAAAHAGETFGPTRALSKGNPDAAWPQCATRVSGTVTTGAQEHVYFETQRTLAIPAEDRLYVHAATQSPSACQHSIASVLGIPMHQIEVEVHRLGGAFGGKEEQAKVWAVLVALGAWLTRRPVWLALSRSEDFLLTGKRHPYVANYQLGLDGDGNILVYEVEFFQDGGAVADLSTAILERTLFHASSGYAIPHASIRATSCRTHKPSNTAFRGFGAPQGIFTIQAALCHAAEQLQVPVDELQHRNLAGEGYVFPYGETLGSNRLREVVAALYHRYEIGSRQTALLEFNRHAGKRRFSKGGALTPICFGIAFTSTHLNQADALVTIYRDGSVAIACSAVEMGQGVYLKVRNAAARTLGISIERIRIDSTTTQSIANMSPTAASTGSDLNGLAAIVACTGLKERLLTFAAQQLGIAVSQIDIRDGEILGASAPLSWEALIDRAYFQRLPLSAHAHYATPDIGYDKRTENGHPFAYYAYGATWVEACVDTLTGRYSIDQAFCVYDIGTSLAPETDRGQIEGAFVQGMGLCTCEEILWDESGHLLTRSLANYKIPDIHAAPVISVTLLEGATNAYGPGNSKAIGEPPLIGGLGAYFAIRAALKAFDADMEIPFALPLTPEKVINAIVAAEERVKRKHEATDIATTEKS